MNTSSRPILFLTGATGLLGSHLASRWLSDGYEVRAVTRRSASEAPKNGIRWVSGDLTQAGDWQEALEGAQAVVHLAGEPISSGRWTESRKASLRRSRLEGTARVVEAMEAASQRPSTFLCASATGYYGPRSDERLDEDSTCGHDFQAQLARDWESAARAAEPLGIRVVRLRFGAILSLRGGALSRMLPPFRLGLGGPMGPAGNFFPWVHEDDAAGLIDWSLQQAGIEGPLNVVSPVEIQMGELARTLGRAVGRPALIPVPLFLLKLALGEMGEALFPGQRVEPRVALEEGYSFRYPEFSDAVGALLR